jgi:hypothetical protein
MTCFKFEIVIDLKLKMLTSGLYHIAICSHHVTREGFDVENPTTASIGWCYPSFLLSLRRPLFVVETIPPLSLRHLIPLRHVLILERDFDLVSIGCDFSQ